MFVLAAALAASVLVDVPSALHAMGLSAPGRPIVKITLPQPRELEEMTVDDKAQIVVQGPDAARRNAGLPLSADPLEHLRRFLMPVSELGTSTTALKCLTQAVYYEAAVEPLEGRRAVAQVILNRMRHPAYPKSVCGVVYQGSERRTGCQFSFTCDGSLLRRPMARPWREAEEVARAALTGYVAADVGTATHYHADYVLPKWAFHLGKITQLGRHIFYRFNGGWGRASAFSGSYSGIERIPAINFAALSERLAADGQTLPEAFSSGLTVQPHVTDRHSETDVGGRLDVTKTWRLAIPEPAQSSARYRQTVEETSGAQVTPQAKVAMAETSTAEVVQ